MSSRIRSEDMHVQQAPKRAGEKHTRWTVNGQLLPLKMYYFFFYGASGSFIPFITVYLKHLRLSASEAGLITGLSMLFAMFLRAVIAMLADKLSAKKSALLICCLGFGLSFFSMWFVPRRALPLELSTNSSSDSSAAHQHQQGHVYTWICWADAGQEICRYPTSLNSCSCRIAENNILANISGYHRRDALRTLNIENFNVSDIRTHKEGNNAENSIDDLHLDLNDEVRNQKQFAETVFYKHSDQSMPCFYIDCESDQFSTSRTVTHSLEHATMLQMPDQYLPAPSGPARNLHYTNPTASDGSRADETTVACLLNCTKLPVNSFSGENSGSETLNVTKATRSHAGSYQSVTADLAFSLSFMLLITGKSLYSASTSLIDAVTYTILGPYSLKWGQQRLWGTVGTGITVLSITVVNDSRQVDSFSGLFIACMGLSILAFLIGLFKLRADRTPKNKMFFRDIRKLLGSGAVRLFLVKLLFYGMMAGTAQNFIFWFLVDLGSGQITLGVCLLLYCVASVIILRYSRLVLHKFGQMKVMYVTLLAYAIRFLVLSFLANPWLALPVETLHAVTYSLFWAAASSTASMVAPPGTQASSQGLAGAIYWDLGRGIGIVIAGQLLHLFGARWTFRAYSLLCVSILPLVWILDRTWTLEKSQVEKPEDSKEKDGEAGEELLKSTTVNGFLLNNNEDKSLLTLSKDGHLDVADTHGESENDLLSCRDDQISERTSVVDDTIVLTGDQEAIPTQDTHVDIGVIHSNDNTTASADSYSVLFSNELSHDQSSINNNANDSVRTNSKHSEYETGDNMNETENLSISVQILETDITHDHRTDTGH